MKKILIILLLLLPGCAWFEDNRTPVKPKLDTTSLEYKKTLSAIINSRYNSEYRKLIAFELAYAEYNLSLE